MGVILLFSAFILFTQHVGQNTIYLYQVHHLLCISCMFRSEVFVQELYHTDPTRQGNWGVCGEFGCVRFLVVCFLYKSILTHEQLFAVGKSGPIATFNLFFFWVGLALGLGVRRFHNNIYMFPNPTYFGISQTPVIKVCAEEPRCRTVQTPAGKCHLDCGDHTKSRI